MRSANELGHLLDLHATTGVLGEVAEERGRQDNRWGEQNHPMGNGGEAAEVRMLLAKSECEEATEKGTLTWAHILREEVAEALAAVTDEDLRTELLQTAAVAIAAVECLDRRTRKDVG